MDDLLSVLIIIIIFYFFIIDAEIKPVVIQQPVLGVVKPGSDMTLQRTVEAKMC